MTSRINHALFHEVARRFAVGNLQRCANSPQNHPALRVTWSATDACFRGWRGMIVHGRSRSDTSSYARAVYHGGRGIGGSRGLHGESFCGLSSPLAFVRREIGQYAAKLFSRRRCCTATGWIHVTFAARRDATRRDATRRVARRHPDFELWIKQVL